MIYGYHVESFGVYHMFFIGSYSEQNAVTYALQVDRRKCRYLTPKEQSYGGVTSIQILYHKRPAPVLSLQLPAITKSNVADAWRSNNMATNETQQPAATTMVIRHIKEWWYIW